ncbi:MAG: hypothetical protein ACFFCM_16560 [Promethearchaeota archaeon]
MEEIKKIKLEAEELKGENILFSNFSSLTSSDFEFSALRSKTQNLQYIGKLFLTNKNLIFKGFNIKELSPIREPADKIVCKIGDPYSNSIDLAKIDKIFVGHDETFGRRHQIFSKLRINCESDGFYFILFDDQLVSVKEKVYERAKEWQAKIEEIRKPAKKEPEKLEEKPTKPEISIPEPKVVKAEVSIPKPVTKTVPKPVIAIPEKKIKPLPRPISTIVRPEPKSEVVTEEPSKEITEEILPNIARLKQQREAKLKGEGEIPTAVPAGKAIPKPSKLAPKVATKPAVKEKTATEILREEEERLKSKFKMTKVKAYEPKGTEYTPLKATMKPISTKTESAEDSAIEKVIGDIREEMDIETLSTEFESMSIDSSINRCPHCGWLLAWDQHKCPKCRKEV